MKHGILSLPLAVVALSLPIQGPAAAQVMTNPAQVQSGTYHVEPEHTQVAFTVLHLGFTNYLGLFSHASGTLELDAHDPSRTKLSVTIPVDSVQTTNSRLTGELKGEQWFDAARFPTATFTSTTVHLTGQDDAIVTGNLTLHGVTKPETLRVHFIGAGINAMDGKYTAGFEATATIRRSDFGIKMYVPQVSDDVQLRMSGAFER